MIHLDSLRVTFHPGTALEKVALKNVFLHIDEGDFITVIGSNGAGKSTLLNAIAGEVSPESGKILIDNRDVTFTTTYERAPWVARVFQDPLTGTCGSLTIAENMALAMKRGKKRTLTRSLDRTTKNLIKHHLETLNLGLENRIDTAISVLSGGQRQAISLLMASLSESRILLLDEHTSALDPKTAAYVLDLTQKIISDLKLTVLMVTHSLQHALTIGNRTIALHEGNIIYDVCGLERANLTVQDLMSHFGKSLDDDRLLLQK